MLYRRVYNFKVSKKTRMKKILFTLFSVCMIAIASNAQTTDAAKLAKAAEKEAKAKHKALQSENIEKALKQAGATTTEIEQFLAINKEASAKSNEIKKNESLTAEQKEELLKENTADKNARQKELLGSKYKEYGKIRKEQKVAEDAILAPYKN